MAIVELRSRDLCGPTLQAECGFLVNQIRQHNLSFDNQTSAIDNHQSGFACPGALECNRGIDSGDSKSISREDAQVVGGRGSRRAENRLVLNRSILMQATKSHLITGLGKVTVLIFILVATTM